MTLRYVQLLSVAMGVGALVACGGSDKDKPTGTTDPDPEPPVVETAPTGNPGPSYFDATEIHISGTFGYDSDARSQVTVEGAYSPLPPQYIIALSVAGWFDFSQVDQYCVVILPFDNATLRTEALKDPRLYYGIDYDGGKKDVALTDCNTEGYELDPVAWGDDPIMTFLYGEEDSYYMAVGDPTKTVSDLFAAYPDLEVNMVGGAMGIPDWLPTSTIAGVVEDTYGYAFEVDKTFNLVYDNDGFAVPIPNTNIWSGTNMATAYYSLNSLTYWTLTR